MFQKHVKLPVQSKSIKTFPSLIKILFCPRSDQEQSEERVAEDEIAPFIGMYILWFMVTVLNIFLSFLYLSVIAKRSTVII